MNFSIASLLKLLSVAAVVIWAFTKTPFIIMAVPFLSAVIALTDKSERPIRTGILWATSASILLILLDWCSVLQKYISGQLPPYYFEDGFVFEMFFLPMFLFCVAIGPFAILSGLVAGTLRIIAGILIEELAARHGLKKSPNRAP